MKKHPKPKLMTEELAEFIWGWLVVGYHQNDPSTRMPGIDKLLDQAQDMTQANDFAEALKGRKMYRGMRLRTRQGVFAALGELASSGRMETRRTNVESWSLDPSVVSGFALSLSHDNDSLGVVSKRRLDDVDDVRLNLASVPVMRRMMSWWANEDRPLSWLESPVLGARELVVEQDRHILSLERDIAALVATMYGMSAKDKEKNRERLFSSLSDSGWSIEDETPAKLAKFPDEAIVLHIGKGKKTLARTLRDINFMRTVPKKWL